MIKKLLFLLALYAGMGYAQECPDPLLISPLNGAADVPVDTQISWTRVTGVPAYLLSLGTTPGGTDLLNELNVGSATSYAPPMGLPADTDIYVTVTLFFFQPDIPERTCGSEMFHTATVTSPPPCTFLSNPTNGAINVNVGTNITWDYAPTATSYELSVGTSEGADDVISTFNTGNVLSYNPPTDFPPNTPLYVSIVPQNALGSAGACAAQTFTTGELATLPDCTALSTPANGATNVDLNPTLEWPAVPDAVGYRVTIGLSPFTGEILNGTNFTQNFTDFIEFEPNRTFFVRIVPYNEAGLAIGCTQTTFSTQLGCGPFFDGATGELVTLNPEISFPETVYYCESGGPQTVTSTDEADGVRWYKLDDMGNETFLGNGFSVEIEETGMYRYEAFNVISQTGGDLECNSTQIFEVLPSGIATITNIDIDGNSGFLRIEVSVTGAGDYEFALDNMDGPYQDSPVFNNIPTGSHTIHVRDRNGCGIVSQDIEQELALDGFPPFFTPNGDGVNDMWQYAQPDNLQDIPLNSIEIYDRFGRLLASISPNSTGWDGTFMGKPLPSDDYWFRANVEDREEIKGHFALKR